MGQEKKKTGVCIQLCNGCGFIYYKFNCIFPKDPIVKLLIIVKAVLLERGSLQMIKLR